MGPDDNSNVTFLTADGKVINQNLKIGGVYNG